MHIWLHRQQSKEGKNQQRPKLWGVYDWGRFFHLIFIFLHYCIEKPDTFYGELLFSTWNNLRLFSLSLFSLWEYVLDGVWQSVMEHTNYVMYKLAKLFVTCTAWRINQIILVQRILEISKLSHSSFILDENVKILILVVLKMKIELMDLKLILVPVCATPVDMQVAYFFTAV